LPTATATPAPTAAPTVAPTASPAGAGAAVPVPGTGGQTGAATTASAALTLSGLAVAPDASGANVFWVVSSGDNTVWRQPAKGDLKAITVGKAPAAIAVGSSGAWVANAGDGTVQRLNLQDGQPAGAPIRVGKNPRSLAIARDAAGNEAIWVANADDGTVQRIDAQSNTVGAPVTVGKGLDAVAV